MNEEVGLKHFKNPQYQGALTEYDYKVAAVNQLCGDQVNLYLVLSNDQIKQISFQVQGCMICSAASSLICQHLKGQPAEEIKKTDWTWLESQIGTLSLSRQKCAKVPLQALQKVSQKLDN